MKNSLISACVVSLTCATCFAYDATVREDDIVGSYFGDVPFATEISGNPLGSRQGFKFFLTDESSAAVLTCIKDFAHAEGKMYWKIVIKSCFLPAPYKGTPRPDHVRGLSGKIFSTRLGEFSSNDQEKRVLKIINRIDEINKGLTSDFIVTKLKGDPMERVTDMHIWISKHPDGIGRLTHGAYLGLAATERTQEFAIYENSLRELLKITEMEVSPSKPKAK